MAEKRFEFAALIAAVIVVVAIGKVRFFSELTLPAPPAPRQLSRAEAVELSREVSANTQMYASYLQADSQKYGVRPVATVEALSAAFPHQIDDEPRTLRPGKPAVEVAGLELRLVIQDLRDSRRKQMVLEIENDSDDALAYRIETQPSKGTKPCHRKSDLPHNAVVVAPHSTELRAECLYRSGWVLTIQKVETVKLPELGAIYVSWMPPAELGLSALTTRGHRPTSVSKPCERVHSAAVQRALEKGEIGWRDLVDFYARHRCTTYAYPVGYKAFREDGERTLPQLSVSN